MKRRSTKLFTQFALEDTTLSERKHWSQQTRSEKCKTIFETVDIFPYEPPINRRRTAKSGITSIIVLIIFLSFIAPEIGRFLGGFQFLNREILPSHRSFASAPLTLPPLIVGPGTRSALAREPFFWNESYYKIIFSQNIIFDSDTNVNKPRIKIKVPGVRCTTKIHKNQDAVRGKLILYYIYIRKITVSNTIHIIHTSCHSSYILYTWFVAWCPDVKAMRDYNLQNFTILGDYTKKEFRYVTADIVVCYNYDSQNNCAPKQEIDDLFFKQYSTNSFFFYQVEDIRLNTYEWKSIGLVSITPNTWTGIESYFHPNQYRSYDSFNVKTQDSIYLQYEWNEKRINARKEDDEIIRYYLRMSETSTIETSTVYTFTNLLSKFGGLGTIIFGFGKLIGLIFNFSKHTAINMVELERKETSNNNSNNNNNDNRREVELVIGNPTNEKKEDVSSSSPNRRISYFDNPKSMTLRSESSSLVSKRKFSGFRSL